MRHFISAYWVAFKTILVKEVRRFLRIWQQTLLPPAITMTLYFIIFGNLIGSRIGEMSGINYISFIMPGLIMMAVINNSYSNVSSSFFSNKFQRSIEELLVAPVPNSVILWGFVFGGVTRGLLTGFIVTLVALFFTDVQVFNLFVLVTVVLLSSILFSLGGFINALFATKFDDVSVVPTFVLTPLSYLGGVFFSTDLLPEHWQLVSQVNPILYMVNGFRYGMLGVSDVSLFACYSILIGTIVVLSVCSMWLLHRGKGIRS
ncbi:ABC transporter permease [Bermanella marisrubri]|uniref:Transport permease protein n=1 Tax=Bermanella marisrubri TaxID=207949 RepID=Q1N6F7_9GAMM|nr:ABC transporter permease [Bermanella marisrubri]EAT13635.1 ABC-type multidrug transport system, permease component [Oceanobacter sp. RED65] [Bermanella marisrubri]QIZ84421.1 ABC transporter permease [Bermanella marisrubri]